MNPRRKTKKSRPDDDQAPAGLSPQRILEALQRAEVPCTLKILAQHLKLQGKSERAALERSLQALVKKGRLVKSRANRYGLAAKMDVVAGTVLAHPDGYAFVKPDEGGEDVYVNRRDARRVLHLDRVQISVTGVDDRGRRKGHVIEILERANDEVVGRYFRESGVGFQ